MQLLLTFLFLGFVSAQQRCAGFASETFQGILDLNTIRVTFYCNLTITSGMSASILELGQSMTPSNATLPISGDFTNRVANWDKNMGELRFNLIRDIPALSDITVEFTLRNPARISPGIQPGLSIFSGEKVVSSGTQLTGEGVLTAISSAFTVTSIVPSTVHARGGSFVTISGSGAVFGSRGLFGTCQFELAIFRTRAEIINATAARCEVPPLFQLQDRLLSVRYSPPFVTPSFSVPSQPLLFPFSAPALSRIEWPTGPAAGGTTIALFGPNLQFVENFYCLFGDKVQPGRMVSNPSALPSGLSGVTDPTSNAVYQYQISCTSPPMSSPASAVVPFKLKFSVRSGLPLSLQTEETVFHPLFPDFLYYSLSSASTAILSPLGNSNTTLVGRNVWQGFAASFLFPNFTSRVTCRYATEVESVEMLSVDQVQCPTPSFPISQSSASASSQALCPIRAVSYNLSFAVNPNLVRGFSENTSVWFALAVPNPPTPSSVSSFNYTPISITVPLDAIGSFQTSQLSLLQSLASPGCKFTSSEYGTITVPGTLSNLNSSIGVTCNFSSPLPPKLVQISTTLNGISWFAGSSLLRPAEWQLVKNGSRVSARSSVSCPGASCAVSSLTRCIALLFNANGILVTTTNIVPTGSGTCVLPSTMLSSAIGSVSISGSTWDGTAVGASFSGPWSAPKVSSITPTKLVVSSTVNSASITLTGTTFSSPSVCYLDLSTAWPSVWVSTGRLSPLAANTIDYSVTGKLICNFQFTEQYLCFLRSFVGASNEMTMNLFTSDAASSLDSSAIQLQINLSGTVSSTLCSISPSVCSAGSNVTLTGSFGTVFGSEVPSCKFVSGSTSVSASVIVLGNYSATCTVPALDAGTYSVSLTSSVFTTTSRQLTVLNPVPVFTVTPSSAPVGGGALITISFVITDITGFLQIQGLNSTLQCNWLWPGSNTPSVATTATLADSDTLHSRYTCEVPFSPGPGTASLQMIYGTYSSLASVSFEFLSEPSIVSISPRAIVLSYQGNLTMCGQFDSLRDKPVCVFHNGSSLIATTKVYLVTTFSAVCALPAVDALSASLSSSSRLLFVSMRQSSFLYPSNYIPRGPHTNITVYSPSDYSASSIIPSVGVSFVQPIITVFGTGFIDTGTITCHFVNRPAQLGISPTAGSFLSTGAIRCRAPKQNSFADLFVSVSLSGILAHASPSTLSLKVQRVSQPSVSVTPLVGAFNVEQTIFASLVTSEVITIDNVRCFIGTTTSIRAYPAKSSSCPSVSGTCVSCKLPSSTDLGITSYPGRVSIFVSVIGIRDSDGDGSSDGVEYTFTFIGPTTVNSISPSFGSIAGKTTVEVRGSGFSTSAAAPVICRYVPLGLTSVATVANEGLAYCKPPAVSSLPTNGSVVRLEVLNSDGKGGYVFGGNPSLDFGMNYRYFNPVIKSLSPSVGMVSGGTYVTIVGTDIPYNAKLSTAYFKIRSEYITIVVLASSETDRVVLGPLQTTTGNPQTVISFFYVYNEQELLSLDSALYLSPSPTVTKISPTAFPSQTGGIVTIVGQYFYNTSSMMCKFVDNSTKVATYISDTTVTCSVPPSQAYTIKDTALSKFLSPFSATVLNNGSSLFCPTSTALSISLDGQFSSTSTASTNGICHYPSPAISKFTPNSSSTLTALTSITVTGSGFSNDVFVKGNTTTMSFGSLAVNASFISSTLIQVSLPNTLRGQFMIPTISLQGGLFPEQQNTVSFRVVAPAPVLTSLLFSTDRSRFIGVFDKATDRGRLSENDPLALPSDYPSDYTSCCRYWSVTPTWASSRANLDLLPSWTKDSSSSLLPTCTDSSVCLTPLSQRASPCLCFCELTLAVLGLNSVCLWSDNSTLELWPGPDAAFTSGNVLLLTFGANVSASSELSGLNAATNFQPSISPPTQSALVPTAVISGPIYSSCSSSGVASVVTVDGEFSTGGLGRPFSFRWSGSGIIGSANQSSVRITIPSSVSITVTNWLGQSASSSLDLTSSAAYSGGLKPLVRIIGPPSRALRKNETLALYAVASLRTCAGDSDLSASSLSFTWRLQSVSSGTVLSQSTGPNFVVSLSSLAGITSLSTAFIAAVTVDNGNSSSSSSNVSLTVSFCEPQLKISGGTTRVVSAASIFRLDASGSRDPNDPTAALTGIFWTCFSLSGVACASGYSLKSLVIDLPASTLVVSATPYNFTLSATSSFGPSSSVSVLVYAVASSLPSLMVSSSTDFIDPGKEIVLTASASSTSAQAVLQPVFAWALPPGISTSVSSVQAWANFSASIYYSQITLTAKFPLSPSMFSFRVSLSEKLDRYSSFGFASIDLKLNRPPFGGNFLVSRDPSNATSCPDTAALLCGVRSTLWKLSANGWKEADDEVPLEYQFDISFSPSGPTFPLQPFSAAFTVTTSLPVTSDAGLVLRVRVRDRSGVTTSTSVCSTSPSSLPCAVIILAAVASNQSAVVASLSDEISSKLGYLSAVRDTVSACRLTLNIASELNLYINTSLPSVNFISQSAHVSSSSPTTYSSTTSFTSTPVASSSSSITSASTSVTTSAASTSTSQNFSPRRKLLENVSPLESVILGKASIRSKMALALQQGLGDIQKSFPLSPRGSGELAALLTSVSLVAQGYNELDTSTRRVLISTLSDASKLRSYFSSSSVIASLAACCSLAKSALLSPANFDDYRTIETIVARVAESSVLQGKGTNFTSECFSIQSRLVFETVIGSSISISEQQFTLTRPVNLSVTSITRFPGSESFPASSGSSLAPPSTSRFVLASSLGRGVPLSSNATITLGTKKYPSSSSVRIISDSALAGVALTVPSPISARVGVSVQLIVPDPVPLSDPSIAVMCAMWIDVDSTWSVDGSLGCARQPAFTTINATIFTVCNCTLDTSSAYKIALLAAPVDCSGAPLGPLVVDKCGVCGGDNYTCASCDGDPAGTKRLDLCGVCGGDNVTCTGCDGVLFSGLSLDWCGVCGGDNSTCAGCDGVPVHPATTSRIFNVTSGKVRFAPSVRDTCASRLFPLGICRGDGSTCGATSTVTFVTSTVSATTTALVSTAPAATSSMAAAMCPPDLQKDSCNVCLPGTSSVGDQSCRGCDGVPRLSGKRLVDACGLCGGNNVTCLDCLGVPNGGTVWDRCGVCGGNNTCLDCTGTPFGSAVRNACGVCGGSLSVNVSQCTGCDGTIRRFPDFPSRVDRKGKCCRYSMMNAQTSLCSCGDGRRDPPFEECDDGNNIAGDGCSPLCGLETNWNCSARNGTQCTCQSGMFPLPGYSVDTKPCSIQCSSTTSCLNQGICDPRGRCQCFQNFFGLDCSSQVNSTSTSVKFVGVSGGSVRFASAVTMMLPNGSLVADTNLSVSLYSASEIAGVAPINNLTLSLPTSHQIYSLGPSGLVFSTPISVGFPIPSSSTGRAAALGAYTFNEITRQWEALPSLVFLSNLSVSATVAHFSLFAVMVNLTVNISAESTPAPASLGFRDVIQDSVGLTQDQLIVVAFAILIAAIVCLFLLLHFCRKRRDVRPKLDVQDVQDISAWEMQRIRQQEEDTTFSGGVGMFMANVASFFDTAGNAAARVVDSDPRRTSVLTTESARRASALASSGDGSAVQDGVAKIDDDEDSDDDMVAQELKSSENGGAAVESQPARSKPTLYRSPSITEQSRSPSRGGTASSRVRPQVNSLQSRSDSVSNLVSADKS